MDKLTIRDLYKNTSTYSEKEINLEGWIELFVIQKHLVL